MSHIYQILTENAFVEEYVSGSISGAVMFHRCLLLASLESIRQQARNEGHS